MKKLSKNIIGLLLCSFLIASCDILSNDNPNFKIYEDGYFQYIHLCDNSKRQDQKDKSLVIVGFTESGVEQETLDIPREINGYEVKRIGIKDEGAGIGFHSRSVTCSEKLKKLYIPNTIKNIECFNGEEVSLMICDNFDEIERSMSASSTHFKRIYLPNKLFKDLDIKPNDSVFSANVSFELNFEAEGISKPYRIDNVENDEKLTIPPKPVREGNSFTGWYTEPECTNIWDFNESPNIEEGSELVLYAGWESIS